MSTSIYRKALSLALLLILMSSAAPVFCDGPEPAPEATIKPETKARLTLQSRISSKLSEQDDIVTATLAEPIYADGREVLARGVEFIGRIGRVSPARRGQRASKLSIEFERIVTPSGDVPIAARVTAIDDWDREETIKADSQGMLKGGHRADRTARNMGVGSQLGLSAGLGGAAIGGAAGASGRQALGIGAIGFVGGMIGGLLLTKGNDISIPRGAILRIQFLKAVTLPLKTTTSALTRPN